MALEQAIHDLERAAADESSAQANPGAWRIALRERLQRVRAGMTEPLGSRDGWLVARTQHAERDRCALLARISTTTSRVSEARTVTTVLPEIRRLSRDLAHYRQRLTDLDYDAVELELGGFD
ncbi:MAG: hypothetical protein NVSMB48_11830 [Marmoricola sp.]